MEIARTALCMECRTALSPGTRCDVHPKALVLDLADSVQRGRAVDEVWGPPHLRARKAAQVGSVGGGGAGVAEVAQGCEGCGEAGNAVSGEAAAAVFVILVAAIAAVILYYVVKWIAHAIRNHRARPRPTGSGWRATKSRHVLRGKVRSAVGITAPLTQESCAAWAVRLTHDRAVGGHTMLRDAETAGLELELDDGRVIAIPAGRIRLDGHGGTTLAVSAPFIQTIDPGHSAISETPVIPATDALEMRLAVGDQVEVIGGLGERFDSSKPTGYRESPETMLVVDGLPSLVRVAT